MKWVVIIGVVFLILQILAARKDRKDLENSPIDPNSPQEIVKRRGLTGEKFTSYNGSCTAILDKEKQELHIFSLSKKSDTNDYFYKHQFCKFNNILSSEVIVNSETVTSTARGSQIGGAVVGGALLGGVGALAGALSGKTTSKENIRSVEIKLTVDDLSEPIYKINFLDTFNPVTNFHKKGYRKDSKEFKSAISEVEKWQGMFDVILHNQS